MSEIIKIEAFVLKKINFSNTSKIVTLYSNDFGKISAIIKGGRAKNSKVGIVVDQLNLVKLVLYKKDNRDIQLISDAELLFFYPEIKKDFEKLKYACAIFEILDLLTVENESNQKLFSGIKRIMELLNSFEETPSNLFCKFFLFFIKELGYAIQFEKCSVCYKEIKNEIGLGYNFEKGIICSSCSIENIISSSLFGELFDYLNCLKSKNKLSNFDPKIISKAIGFLENFIKFHIPEFKGLNSLKIN